MKQNARVQTFLTNIIYLEDAQEKHKEMLSKMLRHISFDGNHQQSKEKLGSLSYQNRQWKMKENNIKFKPTLSIEYLLKGQAGSGETQAKSKRSGRKSTLRETS